MAVERVVSGAVLPVALRARLVGLEALEQRAASLGLQAVLLVVSSDSLAAQRVT